jgi:hypothetical protein
MLQLSAPRQCLIPLSDRALRPTRLYCRVIERASAIRLTPRSRARATQTVLKPKALTLRAGALFMLEALWDVP